jgi:hypothetical protein
MLMKINNLTKVNGIFILLTALFTVLLILALSFEIGLNKNKEMMLKWNLRIKTI